MTKIFFLILLPFVLSITLAPSLAQAAPRPFRIVIDPGHGGDDQGTTYGSGLEKISEKDVTLMLAKRVARQLRAKGHSVVLTRNSDIELPLPARTALANQLHADLFLSIHMNSTPAGPRAPGGETPEGIETYILNNTSNATSKRLASLENSVLGPDQLKSPEQADVALILKDLRLDANLLESKRLACSVQNNLISVTSALGGSRQRNRGVKQALFYVLLGADMPSILVEAGFLNSPRDRLLVLSDRGQKLMAKAIAKAVEEFKSRSSLSRCKVN